MAQRETFLIGFLGDQNADLGHGTILFSAGRQCRTAFTCLRTGVEEWKGCWVLDSTLAWLLGCMIGRGMREMVPGLEQAGREDLCRDLSDEVSTEQ